MKKYLFTKRKFRHVVIGLLLSHVSLVSHASDQNIIENLQHEQWRKIGKFSKLLQKNLGFKENHFEACNNFFNETFKDSGHQLIWRLKAICENANILFHKEMSDESRIEMLKTAFKLPTEEINNRAKVIKEQENSFISLFPKGIKIDEQESFKRTLFEKYTDNEIKSFIKIFQENEIILRPSSNAQHLEIFKSTLNHSPRILDARVNKIRQDYGYPLKRPTDYYNMIDYLLSLDEEAYNKKASVLSKFKNLLSICIEKKEEFNHDLHLFLYKMDNKKIEEKLKASTEIFNILFKNHFNIKIDQIARFFYKSEASVISSLKKMSAEERVKTIRSYEGEELPEDIKKMKTKHQLQFIEIFAQEYLPYGDHSYRSPTKELNNAIKTRKQLFPNDTFETGGNGILLLLLLQDYNHKKRVEEIVKKPLYLGSKIDIGDYEYRDSVYHNNKYCRVEESMKGKDRRKMLKFLLTMPEHEFWKEISFEPNARQVTRTLTSEGTKHQYN